MLHVPFCSYGGCRVSLMLTLFIHQEDEEVVERPPCLFILVCLHATCCCCFDSCLVVLCHNFNGIGHGHALGHLTGLAAGQQTAHAHERRSSIALRLGVLVLYLEDASNGRLPGLADGLVSHDVVFEAPKGRHGRVPHARGRAFVQVEQGIIVGGLLLGIGH